jgi:hypothetical protein
MQQGFRGKNSYVWAKPRPLIKKWFLQLAASIELLVLKRQTKNIPTFSKDKKTLTQTNKQTNEQTNKAKHNKWLIFKNT